MEQELNHQHHQGDQIDQIGLDYLAGSYKESYSSATLHADVSNLQLPSNFAHGIIILHVLEHVAEVDDALLELKRVMLVKSKQGSDEKSKSWMMVEVPYLSKDGLTTGDCRDLKTDEERIACAGQADHVWAFAQSDFEQRLSNFGFDCQDVIPMVQQSLGKELTAMLKLTTDNFRTIQYLCRVKESEDWDYVHVYLKEEYSYRIVHAPGTVCSFRFRHRRGATTNTRLITSSSRLSTIPILTL